ncbi:MAG: hypothetical protein IIB60_05955 [Planctomycetes bacterium]|nr:hypothetical protein [Planctomycetota bacterium]
MIPRATEYTKRYQIGVVDVSLLTPVRELMRQHASLYRRFEVDGSPGQTDAAIRVTVRPTRPSAWRRRRFIVSVNDRMQFEPARVDEVLPYIEWAVNWEIPRVMPQYLQLHASSLEVDGMGVILPGDSGSGKSTLTAGLLAGGWRYLCDEFALIHADTLELHPYPRAICIKKPSYEAIESVGLKLHGYRHYLKGSKGYVGFIDPLDVRSDAVGDACPIRYVVFPKYVQGAEPRLTPMSRADAAFALHRVCFNLLTCKAIGLDVLAGLVRGASCYRLTCGDLQETCAVMQDLIAGAPAQLPRESSSDQRRATRNLAQRPLPVGG